MLSAEDNARLTRVGRGTPMGELMRRYWQPVAAVAQLDEHPTLPVRLMGEDLVLYRDTRGPLRPARPPLRPPAGRPRLRHRGGLRPALSLPRLAVRRRRRLPRAAVRGGRAARGALQGQDPADCLPGRGQGWAAVGLPRPGPGAARARLGSLPPARLQADRVLRDPVQLGPGPGELHRPHPLRVAALQLVGGPAGRRRPGAAPPEDRLRGVRVGLHLPARARGHHGGRRAVDGRARLPVAQLPLHRQVRVAGADRRRAHAARGVVQRSRSGRRTVRAGADSLLARTDPRPADGPLDHQPHHEPGLRRLDRPGRRRRSHAGASGRERPRRHPVAPAPAGGGRHRRPRRRSQGGRPRSHQEPAAAAADASARGAGRRFVRPTVPAPWSSTPGSRPRSWRR